MGRAVDPRTWRGSGLGGGGTPVLPGLHAVPVQQEVEGLPVVEHLVAVVYDVEQGAQQPRHQQARKDELHPWPPAVRRPGARAIHALFLSHEGGRHVQDRVPMKLCDCSAGCICPPMEHCSLTSCHSGIARIIPRSVCVAISPCNAARASGAPPPQPEH